MKSFSYVITDAVGIHARPAGMLVKEVAKHKSVIMIDNGTKQVNAKKLMAVMSMGVKKGHTVTITAEGEDEVEAIAAMEEFFKTNL